MEYYLSPSVLPMDMGRLAESVQGLVEAGVKWIQVDVMDGHFVPNFTYGPPVVEAIRKRVPDDVLVDAHLMIDKPELWALDYHRAGANLVTVHVEATVHLHRVIQSLKEAGAKAGAAVNPATPVSTLYDVLPDLDLALVMSVNPGFGGQKFIPVSLNKTGELRAKIDALGLDVYLQVDGGIKLENITEVVRAGANSLVVGSGVFGHEAALKGDFRPIVEAFNAAIKKGIQAR